MKEFTSTVTLTFEINNLSAFDKEEYIEEVDTIFEILEGAVDKYYDKLEAAKKKQPKAEW